MVSDFGLGTEIGSVTRFTNSMQAWGTHGYLPPEFRSGGFKNVSEASDIYMLGKAFYALLTGLDPTYIMEGGIHPALFHVIERACERDKSMRYANLAELRQAMTLAFDVMLNRGGLIGKISQLLDTIQNGLRNENRYNPDQIVEFIGTLPMVDKDDQVRICYELGPPFMMSIIQGQLVSHIVRIAEMLCDFAAITDKIAWYETAAGLRCDVTKVPNHIDRKTTRHEGAARMTV